MEEKKSERVFKRNLCKIQTGRGGDTLIISILSYQEVKKHHYGWDTMDFNDNVRRDFNYG